MKVIVSILTTVYNREKYLSQCIESVLVSTFQNWEMIIVDDCSTDNSVEIARAYEKKDSRIKLLVNEKNLGDYPNRNRAASFAKGKYIKYLDADDMIYPQGLEIFVKTMEKFPEAAIGISQEVAEDNQAFPFLLSPRETYQREFLKRGLLGVAPTMTIIKRSVFMEFGGFSGERFIGDRELWLKVTRKYPLVKVEPGLVYWRQHDGQEYQLGFNSNFYLENNYKLKMSVLKNMDCPLSQKDIDMAIMRLKNRFTRDILNLAVKQGKLLEGIRIFKSSNISGWEFVNSIFK